MDLNDYFKTIAETHVEIGHTEENKAFFREFASARILLDTDFHQNLRYASDNLLISQFNDDSSLPVPTNDFSRESPSGTLYILSRIKDANMENARLKAIQLRNDIFARIKQDIKDSVIPKSFVFNNISSQTIGRIADNFYGIALHISYSNKYTATFDQSKWTSVS